MTESRTSNPDFGQAFDEARKHAANVAGDAADAARGGLRFRFEGGPENRWQL